MGSDWGLTVKQRFLRKWTAELIVQNSIQREKTTITLAATKHNHLLTRNLNIYYGPSVHRGWYNPPVPEQPFSEQKDDPWGIGGIAGLELSLFRLNLAYDVKPSVNLQGGTRRVYVQSGLSLRYIIWKRKKYDWEKQGIFGTKKRKRK